MKIKIIIFALIALTAAGCGKKDETLSKKLGSKLGEVATDFGKGVGSGIDKKMIVSTEISDAVRNAGLSMTTSKIMDRSKEGSGITVYFIAEKDFSSKVICTALNSDDLEIGRSIMDIEMKKDQAEYISFKFMDEMDMQLVKKFSIDIKK